MTASHLAEHVVRFPARPAPAPPRPYAFPAFTRDRLANGLEVIVAPIPRLPLVSIRFYVDAGAGIERQEDAGLALLTARAMAEGTLRSGGAQLAEEFERLGGSLSTTASWEGVHLHTSVLNTRFAPAMRLLAEVALEPAFPARDVDRLREERLAELLELRAEPRGLADERFLSLLYHPSVRYALPEGGSEATVSTFTRERCQEYHARHFGPAVTSVIVVGDVEREPVLEVVHSVLGDWRTRATLIEPLPARAARPDRALHVIARPDAPQTELRAGHLGLPRAHPDYYDVTVMNAILGGVFNSRINLNLRERHGFTYGASSGFDWRRDTGPWAVSTAVATDVTQAALREIVGEIERMRSGPPTPDEVSLATSYLDGVFPIRFETTDAVAAALTSLRAFGLADDYYDTYRERIRAVDAAAVERAATAHLHPDQLQIVAVGDPERVGTQLEGLQLGPVHYWTAEGALVSRTAAGAPAAGA